jgi:transposase
MLPEINAEMGKKSKGVGQRAQKRRYSLEYKLQVVKETLAPGASVSLVARRHDINSNVVFCWRKLFRERARGNGTGSAVETGFIPIHVVDGETAMRALPAPERPRGRVNGAPAVHNRRPHEPAETLEEEKATDEALTKIAVARDPAAAASENLP